MTWISGNFARVHHKDVPHWVGGAIQKVYVGQTIAKTFRFSGNNNPTGLWIVVNNDAGHPVPSWPATYDAAGTTLTIELRTDNLDMVSEGLWIDRPENDNVGCQGASYRDLGDATNTANVYNGGIEKVYRFNSPDDPSGLWVTTGTGNAQPIPTYPTAIEVGGMNLGVELRATLGRNRTHRVCWLDVTPVA